jgi:hypothetical protein
VAVLATLVLTWAPPASAAIHDYAGAVPVLVYHGLHAVADPARDPYSIAPAEFGRQMAMLDANGFHAVSIGQYARFAAGDVAALPDRPILITFDDGRLDSYLAADPILARFGLRATIFVITAKAEASAPGYLGWPQLAAIAAAGRWDVQEHAHAGHVLIPTGPRGATGPFYANLLYRNGARETFTTFKRRVTSDILAGRRLLASHIPGFGPLAFAVPYGNYGQVHTNYAPIPSWERGWLQGTFRVLFVQDRPAYNLPGAAVGQRYAIHASTTAAKLQAWLVNALPRSAWINPAPAPPPAHRPSRPKLRSLYVGRRHVTMVLRAPAGARLKADRRRGRAHRHRVRVGVRGRLRDRRLRPHTRYVYRVFAVDGQGRRSRPLVVRVRTKAVTRR